ncbi:MAG: hypothetical protein U0744_17820 [Gemmataceae bacterium]
MKSATASIPCEAGEGSQARHSGHIMPNCTIGKRCILGQNVVVSPNVTLNADVKIRTTCRSIPQAWSSRTTRSLALRAYSRISTTLATEIVRQHLYEKPWSAAEQPSAPCDHRLRRPAIGRFAFIAAKPW